MLSTALVKTQEFWFICCVGNSNKHWISLQALSSCCGLWGECEAHPWAVPLGCRNILGSNSHSLWWDLHGAALQFPGKEHDVLPHLITKIQSFENLSWVTLLCWLFLSSIKALCHLLRFPYPTHRQKLDARLTQHAKSSEQREQEHHIIMLALIWKGQMPAVLASCRNCSSSHMLSWVPTEEIEFTVFSLKYVISLSLHICLLFFIFFFLFGNSKTDPV